MNHINNNITPDQWKSIQDAAEASRTSHNEPPNALYMKTSHKNGKTRHYIYDNYDRFYMPGIDYIVDGKQKTGRLYIYNSSKMSRAPITLDQGLTIARNFFNEYGGQMSEEIVCEYVMLSNQEVKF